MASAARGKKWATCSFVDQHCLDADSDFHVDADPEPDQDPYWHQTMPILAQVLHMLENQIFLSQHCHFTVFYLSHQCQMCHILLVFWWACWNLLKVFFLNFIICFELIPIRQNDADPTRSRSGSTTMATGSWGNLWMGSLPPSFIVPVLSVVDPHPHQALDPHECASFCKPGSASGSASTTNKNPDPDPHQIKIRIQTRLRVISQIWVLIKVMRIHNTAGIDPDFCLGQTTLYL